MENHEIGSTGELVAREFLMKRGYSILDRNYRKSFGEIDIIAKKEGVFHFVEVKTSLESRGISHETSFFRPEERVGTGKLSRMSRAASSYLVEKRVESEFQIDVVAVTLNPESKQAKVRFIENVNAM